MKSEIIILEKSQKYYSECIPHISIDSVIFGFNKNKLRVLLLNMEFNNEWFLPGGYLNKEEDIENAAKRIVKDRTGLENVFLEEFAIFGKYKRSEDTFSNFDDNLWHKQRFVTVGYYALLNYSLAKLIPDDLTQEMKWVYIEELDSYNITMDHRDIIKKALKRLQESIAFRPIGLNLLPEKFTLSELQKLYEAILGKNLNRGNFYRKIKNMDILIKLDETRKNSAYKSSDLYSFNIVNYENILSSEIKYW